MCASHAESKPPVYRCSLGPIKPEKCWWQLCNSLRRDLWEFKNVMYGSQHEKEAEIENLITSTNIHGNSCKSYPNRIKSVIPKLINNDQTGFLKGRYIGESIRLIDNIIDYASQKNIPGLLLFIDFEKAFDSLEWSFIERTLQYFGFGSSLISWFQTFYKNIESCVLNNGWASCFFSTTKRC